MLRRRAGKPGMGARWTEVQSTASGRSSFDHQQGRRTRSYKDMDVRLQWCVFCSTCGVFASLICMAKYKSAN